MLFNSGSASPSPNLYALQWMAICPRPADAQSATSPKARTIHQKLDLFTMLDYAAITVDFPDYPPLQTPVQPKQEAVRQNAHFTPTPITAIKV